MPFPLNLFIDSIINDQTISYAGIIETLSFLFDKQEILDDNKASEVDDGCRNKKSNKRGSFQDSKKWSRRFNRKSGFRNPK